MEKSQHKNALRFSRLLYRAKRDYENGMQVHASFRSCVQLHEKTKFCNNVDFSIHFGQMTNLRQF